MFELIYRSVALPSITSDDIKDILITSRNFNTANNITGCLVFNNNEFIQILEGDKDTIKALYTKIEKDRRHTNVMLLDENEKDKRIFPNWGMAYFDSNNYNANENDRLLFMNNFVITANITEKPTHAIKLFWHIAKILVKE